MMTMVDHANLNDVMEFDHVIEVRGDGTVIARPDVYAPNLYDDDFEPGTTGWALLNGYSGQHGYSGPMMHQSEFIGGRMARDILDTPGVYVALVNYTLEEDADGEWYPTEWAVAYRV